MSSVLDELLEAEPAADIVSLMTARRPAFILSLDVGTSGVRASLFDDRGDEIAGSRVISRRTVGSFSAFAELNPDQLVEQVVETIDELFENANYENVEHVAISCFWHSLMGVDAKGNATTSLLTWADTRASEMARQLLATLDEADIHARTGCRFHSSYWPAKLRWLRAVDKEAFQKTKCWLGLSEYLSLRLFGTAAASISMASATGLFNQSACDWDWDFVDSLGISRELLPGVGNDETPRIRDEFAVRWPALASSTLSAVVGDGAANNIGGGCCTRDRIALMVGTSGAMRVIYEGAPPDSLPSALWCYRVDRARVVVGGALSDGGGLYRWLTDLMSLGDDSIELETDLAETEADAHGLTVLPFWSGERSPGWSPEARGGIFGLTQETKPVEIVRAALEAISYRFALIARALEQIAPGAAIIATGNALRSSPVWLQILSDVLGRPLMYGGSSEASIRGAALLALETVGKIGNIEDTAFAVDEVFEPDMTRSLRYQEALKRQEDLYQRLFPR